MNPGSTNINSAMFNFMARRYVSMYRHERNGVITAIYSDKNKSFNWWRAYE